MKPPRTFAILNKDDKKRASQLLKSKKLKLHEALPLRVAWRLNKGDSVAAIGRRYEQSRQNINDIKKKKLATYNELINLFETLEEKIKTRTNTRERVEKIVQSTGKDIYKVARDHKVKPEVVLAVAEAAGKDGDLIADEHKIDPNVVYVIAEDLGVSLGKGATSVAEYRAALDISAEPVIELAGMYMNSLLSVAVIALRETEEYRTDLVGLFRFPPSILQEEVQWTTVSRIDDVLNELFSRLRTFRPSSQSWHSDDPVPFVQKVREEYPVPYKLVIIHDIQNPETGKELDRMCHTSVHVPSADFLSRLEHIAHAFRHRRSCAGLFPSASDLRSELPSPRLPNLPCPAMDNSELNWIGSSVPIQKTMFAIAGQHRITYASALGLFVR